MMVVNPDDDNDESDGKTVPVSDIGVVVCGLWFVVCGCDLQNPLFIPLD